LPLSPVEHSFLTFFLGVVKGVLVGDDDSGDGDGEADDRMYGLTSPVDLDLVVLGARGMMVVIDLVDDERKNGKSQVIAPYYGEWCNHCQAAMRSDRFTGYPSMPSNRIWTWAVA